MPPPKEKGMCKCGFLQRAAEEPNSHIEFDPKLNEFHITGNGADHLMIYYCPFCGGSAPKSMRSSLFHTLTGAERRRLCELTKNLRTVDAVIAALGQPDIRHAVGLIAGTPERDGKPETTQGYPTMIYSRLSDTANIEVLVYPTDKVAITFVGKSIKHEEANRSDLH